MLDTTVRTLIVEHDVERHLKWAGILGSDNASHLTQFRLAIGGNFGRERCKLFVVKRPGLFIGTWRQ